MAEIGVDSDLTAERQLTSGAVEREPCLGAIHNS
jgi:hypothetical protein